MLRPQRRIMMKNNVFSRSPGGIKLSGFDEVVAEDNIFIDVDQPFDVDAKQVRVTGTRNLSSGQDAPSARSTRSKSSVGFSGVRAPALPATCPVCQSVFPSRKYNVRTPRFYGFDNTETCTTKNCGGRARLVEGVFDLSDAVVRVIEGESLTFEMVAAIATAAQSITNDLAPEEATVQIERISPGYGAIFRRYLTSPTVLSWIAIFTSLLPTALDHAFPENKPDCVITRSRIDDGQRIDLKLQGAIDLCFAQLKSLEVHTGKNEAAPGAAAEPNDPPPEKRTTFYIDPDNVIDLIANGSHLILPKKGPVPELRPRTSKRGDTKKRLQTFGRSRTR